MLDDTVTSAVQKRLIEMPFGLWARWTQGTMYWMGVHIIM